MRLTVLVPTRGRPENARRLLEACDETSFLQSTEIVLGVDWDDPLLGDYRALEKRMARRHFLLEVQPSTQRGMVPVLNGMADERLDDSDAIGFLGDDHLPRTPGWDKALCDALAGKPAALAYGNDLLQGERIPTAVAMTASIPRTLGYMAPPQLRHLYVDNVWRDWGDGLGALTYLPDVVIEHLHPAAGKAERDAGYNAVNAADVDSADRAAYLNYRDGGQLAADLDKLRVLT